MVGTEDDTSGRSKRASGRLGKPDEPKPEESRLSGRRDSDKYRKTLKQIAPADGPKLGSSGLTDKEVELTATGSFAIPPKDYKPADRKTTTSLFKPPAQQAPAADSTQDVPQLSKKELEDIIEQPVAIKLQTVRQTPKKPVTAHADPYQVDNEHERARLQQSARIPQPAIRNEDSNRTQGDTDKLLPVGKKGAPPAGAQTAHPGQPSDKPPTDSDLKKDESGSRRAYLSTKGDYLPPKPTLTLTRKVEYALQGKRSLEKDILPLRHGLISVHLSIDLLKARQCGIIIKHADSKTPELIMLQYHAPRDSKRPGETGIDNAFEPTQIIEHTAHKDHLTAYAIPDGDANLAYVRKWVHRAADASLLGRPAITLVKAIEQAATLITHRTTLASYLGAVCELARSEIDARQATKLVIEQGLAWNLKQQAPEVHINAQAMLVNEYDRLIARWTAAYNCGHLLAQEYGLALGTPGSQTTGDAIAQMHDTAGKTTAIMTKPKKQ